MAQYWFIPDRPIHRSKLALVTFVLAFFVILLGAYTRLTDAGLSCPDWPNCFGYLTAPHTPSQIENASQQFPSTPVNVKKAWTEMTHRYFAGTEGLLILMLVGAMFVKRKSNPVKVNFMSISLLSLLGIQVLLGMLTVTAKLKPIIVTGHLITGLSLLSLLWWTYLSPPYHPPSYQRTSPMTPWIGTGLLIVFFQISLGGWVSSHYAGLACIDFPYCNGAFFPHLEWQALSSDLITIHMLHRFGAFITAIYLSFLCFFLLKERALSHFAIAIFALICLQLTLGILNLLWLRPVWVALFHHAIAIILLLTLMACFIKAASDPKDRRYACWTK